jgi:hypothetical protein
MNEPAEQKTKDESPKRGKWGKTVKVSLGVLGGLSLLMGYISATGMSQSEGEAAARKAIDDFFASFNARDQEGARKSLKYPHVQIAGAETRMWNDPEEVVLDFETLTAAEGWHHSTLDYCSVRQNAEDKIHFEIRFSRYNADGARYATYQSIWIVTKSNGHWGIQCSSSLAL